MKKVLLIGDSIRQGYDKYVKQVLADSCEVYYPKENCRFAQFVLRHLSDWKKELNLGDDVDAVHWNTGLWDTLVQYGDGCLTPPEVYEAFIDRICRRIRVLFPNAKVIFATSTPVVESRFPNPTVSHRKNRDIEKYNEIAVNIAKKYGFFVNDLYAAVKDVPEDYYSDMTHLYTPEGTRILTSAVLRSLCSALALDSVEFTLSDYQTIKDVLGL